MRTAFFQLCVASVAAICGIGCTMAQSNKPNNTYMEEKLNMTQEWDKVFAQSDKVNHSKITFHNRYGITLAADMYMPKNAEGKLPAIAVCGPFGAVKEQASGLYAQTLAERGFITIAFDPSFTGESGGNRDMWHRPTLTPKTSARRSITCQPAATLTRSASAYSAFADGEEWL